MPRRLIRSHDLAPDKGYNVGKGLGRNSRIVPRQTFKFDHRSIAAASSPAKGIADPQDVLAKSSA